MSKPPLDPVLLAELPSVDTPTIIAPVTSSTLTSPDCVNLTAH